MDKKRLEYIAVIILIVIFVLTLANSFKKIRPKAPSIKQKAPIETLPMQKVEPIFKVGEQAAKEELIENKLGWGRDPFILEELAQGGIDSIAGLKLMGITVGEKTKSMAIINNEMVSVGTKIGKFTVLKIQPDKVVVTDGEDNFELKMK